MNEMPGKKWACVVAHPDDEVLWAGGLLQRGDWTVICCSIPRRDPIRAWNFFKCCDVLGVKTKLLPFEESEPDTLLGQLNLLDLDQYDVVFTHNAKGEYGHFHHQQVHKHVVQNYEGRIFTFGYGSSEGKYQWTNKLSEVETDIKMKALQCYSHEMPYHGVVMPKWKALLTRYMHDTHLDKERFNAL